MRELGLRVNTVLAGTRRDVDQPMRSKIQVAPLPGLREHSLWKTIVGVCHDHMDSPSVTHLLPSARHFTDQRSGETIDIFF
ncbi:hypothetical protein JOE65_001628 [Arthrobacter roseus]|nr:hypothetical protein [Arthrobacter roseus]